MIGKKLNKSVVITGASAAGKTTLWRRLLVHYQLCPLPIHLTRKIRVGEIDNIDGFFISEEDFKSRFFRGDYMQSSLESTYFSGAYYGCPKDWITLTEKGNFNCFVSPTVKIAKKLKNTLGQKIIWIHLTVDEKTLRKRLIKRDPDLDKEYIKLRIKRGIAFVDISGHDILIDTSNLNAWEIFFRALVNI